MLFHQYLLIFLALMPFVCYKPCTRSFDTDKGLRLHQQSCSHAGRGVGSVLQKRKLAAEERTAVAKLREVQVAEAQRQALREQEADATFQPDDSDQVCARLQLW